MGRRVDGVDAASKDAMLPHSVESGSDLEIHVCTDACIQIRDSIRKCVKRELVDARTATNANQ
jgi:hypothetical protein